MTESFNHKLHIENGESSKEANTSLPPGSKDLHPGVINSPE